MTKRKVFIAVLVLGLGIAGTAFLVRPSRHAMPVYLGKTARQWLDDIFTTNQTQAESAFRQMGSSAVPYLVYVLQRTNSAWESFYAKEYPKLPQSIRDHLSAPLMDVDPWDGTEVVRPEALRALEIIGPDRRAIPALTNLMRSTDFILRYTSLQYMRQIDPKLAEKYEAMAGNPPSTTN